MMGRGVNIVADMLESSTHHAVTPQMLRQFAQTARKRMRADGGGYRRDHLRLLAQRVEVADKEVRITGSKSNLLRTLLAISSSGAKSDSLGVPSSVLKWRRIQSRSNPSPPRNSLLTGKLTGNFADSGTPPRILRPISDEIQQLTAKFPTQRNRESLEA
jgi:hypothetical protein